MESNDQEYRKFVLFNGNIINIKYVNVYCRWYSTAMMNFNNDTHINIESMLLKEEIYLYNYKINIYYFVFLVLLIGNYPLLPDAWFSDSFKATIKFLFLLLLCVFLFSERTFYLHKEFKKGLLLLGWI